MIHTERFAPSPTGPLHLGHAFSALTAWQAARAAGGRFLLRIEDLDAGRVREGFVRAILDDLAWLGIDWDAPPLRQSTRVSAHEAALARLSAAGLTYCCACSRRDIADAVQAPQEGAAPSGPDGLVYPGTCRRAPPPEGASCAIRLDMQGAIAALGGAAAVSRLTYQETGGGAPRRGSIALSPDALVSEAGDVVLRRRDGAVAYHLAVVVDDAYQRVSHVTRGADLAPATPVHRLLQALLDLPVPIYCHHRLIRDAAGHRLAKRDGARALAALRDAGETPEDLRTALGL